MNIVRPVLPQSCRIICVSDIHAYLDDFKTLLEKCGYGPDTDYLFILGDIIEKGTDNISTLNYVQKLCQNPKTIFIQGNNDTMPCRMAFNDGKSRFFDRLQSRPTNTFVQMAETIGITDFTENFEQKRQKVTEAYRSQLDFIQNAPIAIETKDFIFVHAAIENALIGKTATHSQYWRSRGFFATTTVSPKPSSAATTPPTTSSVVTAQISRFSTKTSA